MSLQIDFWQFTVFLIGLLITFLGAAAGVARLFLGQFEKRMDGRFAALERVGHEDAAQWRKVERDVMTLRAELPLHYVRREDYVRNQTIIEAKLDAVALRLENLKPMGVKP